MFVLSQLVLTRAVTNPVTPPVTPPNTKDHSTGGVTAVLGALTYKLEFEAKGDKLQGNVNYKSTSGTEFKGKVNVCYYQSGNEAAFAGTIDKGNVSEDYFLIKVQDNGEGKKSPADKLNAILTNSVPTCSLGGYPAAVTNGNLQVH